MTKPNPAAEKQKVGRPTAYKPEYADLAYKFCLLGATDKDLASFFDVVEQTIYGWKATIPEFLEATRKGKERADAEVAQSLFHRAKGYEHEAVKIFMPAGAVEPVYADYTERYPPDTAAASLWLRNRQPDKWRDKITTEVSGPNGGPIQTEEVGARAVLAQRIASIVERAVANGDEPADK